MLSRLFSGKPSVPEIDVQTFARERADSTDVQVIDVREPDEWAGGHLSGATLIPLGELSNRLGELDPARPVVVVCRSGNRSGKATDFLIKSGFKDVKNLTGGMIAWTEAGFPAER